MSQDDSVSLVHLIRRPTVPSEGKAPLLILLHGVRSNEQDLMGLADYLDGRFFIASVRGPVVFAPGAYGWYHIEFTSSGLVHDPDEAARGRLAAEHVIDELTATYDLDPKRVYLMGFSQGAITSLGVALTQPEKIAGAVLMSGRLLPEVAAQAATPDRLAHLRILVTHGRWDEVLPVEMGHEIRDFLTPLPVDLEYHEYTMGHQVTPQSLADIAAWLTGVLDA